MKKPIGITEAVNIIIGKQVYYNASELLDSTLEELMVVHGMTEKEALRIMAVNHLRSKLEIEKLSKQYGFRINSSRDLIDIAEVDLKQANHILVIGLNNSCSIVTKRTFPLTEPGLYKNIFRYLCCEPISKFIVVIKESALTPLSEDIGFRLKDIGATTGLELQDCMYWSGVEFLSMKSKGLL